jgi:hypothetical protein
VQVTVKVVDDDNQPVPDAKVVVMGYSTKEEGNTDGSGFFPARLRNVTGQLDFVVRKEGFYTIGWVSYYFMGQTNGWWEPRNPIVELQLRRRGDPVPMVVKCLKGSSVPGKGQPFGFDLLAGDWVSPNGGGRVSDFVFTVNGTVIDRYNFTSRLTVECSNVGDGLIQRRVHRRDDYGLRLPAIAPADGYSNRWEFFGDGKLNPATGQCELTENTTEDDNYYLRVRTKRNEKGEITSAMYGKIYHPIGFEPGFQNPSQPTLSILYYLNPDGTRNTEFDTRSNLCPNPGDAGGKP